MIRLLISLLLITSCQVLLAERYITLAPHLTEILYDLNVGDQIVGTVEHSDYPEQARQIAVIGNFQQLNIESIVALKPKIIFAWPDGNPELQLDRLEQLGIRIFKSAPADLTELVAEIKTIGQLVNQAERAQVISKQLQDDIQKVTSQYQSLEMVDVFYQIWHQPLRGLGSDPWLNDILNRCGARNIFTHLPQPYPLVSLESVVSKQPDIIILPESNQQAAHDQLWHKWNSLKAVKSQQIITINADWLHRYTRRSIQGVKSLCSAIDATRRKQ